MVLIRESYFALRAVWCYGSRPSERAVTSPNWTKRKVSLLVTYYTYVVRLS